jgi:hypothetical protein
MKKRHPKYPPFKKMSQVILIELIYFVVLLLNAFPTKTGISAMLSPHKILYRHKLDFAKHCKALFMAYCKAHNKSVPTNTVGTRSTPTTVLGPTGNLQGTYKFFSLATGKKIKQRKMMAYPMPDLLIKKVELFGKANTTPNILDFLDRNGVLFKWNVKVDKYQEGIVEGEVVLYPALAAEILGMVFNQNQPIPLIDDKIQPQGRAEDSAAQNVNIEPFDIAGVDALTMVCANNDEINKIDDDNDNIMSIATIPPANDLDDANANDDKSSNSNKSSYNKSSNNGNPGTQHEIVSDKPVEDPTESEDQGVRESKHKNNRRADKYKDNGLMIKQRQKVIGGKHHATIRGEFFLVEDLSSAEPVAEEDGEEWALGVALAHYSMGAIIKKFWEWGKAGMTKELTQMHNMSVF